MGKEDQSKEEKELREDVEEIVTKGDVDWEADE